jgi:hypothetical protein
MTAGARKAESVGSSVPESRVFPAGASDALYAYVPPLSFEVVWSSELALSTCVGMAEVPACTPVPPPSLEVGSSSELGLLTCVGIAVAVSWSLDLVVIVDLRCHGWLCKQGLYCGRGGNLEWRISMRVVDPCGNSRLVDKKWI